MFKLLAFVLPLGLDSFVVAAALPHNRARTWPSSSPVTSGSARPAPSCSVTRSRVPP
jgi:hypothetical protein